MSYQRSDYESAADYIRERSHVTPRFGLVLGSGLGPLADEIEEAVRIPYDEIPGFPQLTVAGHVGQLVIGHLQGQPVVAQQGRAHFYEGLNMQQITFPVRVMAALGIELLMLTNAAGGINPAYAVGELMMICDHINLPGMVGNNPLLGRNDESLGPRFVDLSRAYDRDMRVRAREIASAHNIPLHEGVYVGLSGPNFETPAEVRFLRGIGADAVGMSTVPEVLVARHSGLRVFACSGITNVAIDDLDAEGEASHEEVLEAGKVLVPRLSTLVRGLLEAFDA